MWHLVITMQAANTLTPPLITALISEQHGVRVVHLGEIPTHDWERGARGEGDFWDTLEQEVERRLEEGSVNK